MFTGGDTSADLGYLKSYHSPFSLIFLVLLLEISYYTSLLGKERTVRGLLIDITVLGTLCSEQRFCLILLGPNYDDLLFNIKVRFTFWFRILMAFFEYGKLLFVSNLYLAIFLFLLNETSFSFWCYVIFSSEFFVTRYACFFFEGDVKKPTLVEKYFNYIY